MRMNFSVANITLADRPQWEKLYAQYAEFYKMPMTSEILETVWSWIVDPQHPFYCLIAKSDQGQVLGLMHCREMASPLRGGYVGFLDDLFVLPEFRGSGVVDELFKHLKSFSRNKGWPFVRWMTSEDNYRACGVYDKLAVKTHWLTYQMPID